MFRHFFFTEVRYALKQPMVYIFMFLMALLAFGATSSDNIQIGGAIGNIHKNSPHIITVFTTIMTIFGLLIAAAFFNNAAIREFRYGFQEILYTTPLQKAGYFFGRFLGALFLSTIPMLGVFLGIMLGSVIAPLAGWEDPERFGAFSLTPYINNYFLFILPNMFIAGTIIFAMAIRWKSTVISFVGALIVVVGYFIAGTLLSDIENETLAGMTDIFGIRAYSLFSKYYTPIEKNTLSPGFSGLLLWNRLLWMGLGTAILTVSYFLFSFRKGKQKSRAKTEKAETKRNAFVMPTLHPTYNQGTSWLQFKSFFKVNFLSIVKGVTFKILFLFSAILLISSLWGGFDYFGLQSYPVTYKIIDTISSTPVLFVIIVLVFFSGELVWRDRESKISEVIDSTPHTSIISMAAKALSLVAVTVVMQAFFVLCGVLYQLANGYFRIELGVYFLEFFYNSLPVYIVWSGLMIFIQVLLHNKYVGYFVSILVVFILGIILSLFDVSSNMLFIGGGPTLTYSDMNSFGPGLTGALWFNAYWLLFALICLMLAGVLWNRGAAAPLAERIATARKRVPGSFRLVIGGVTAVWILVAAFVYYNTQILNPYKSSDDLEEQAAQYEKTYKKYEDAPLPKVTDAKYEINIFPEDRDVFVNATVQLTNETEVPIDSIHFNIDKRWNPVIDIPGSEIVLDDEVLGYRIYKLKQAMRPGASMTAVIKTSYESKGFQNNTGNTSVVENGTFLNNFAVMPGLGYSANVELSDKNTRKKYDLAPKDRMPELQHNCSKSCMANYLSDGHSDYIPVETIISTSEDQMAVAPGSLVKEWTEDGRKYFHYKVDHPSQNFFSFISARYEVARRKWKGIDLEVYHDSKHTVNVEMMLDAMERSLDYYTTHFGPYYHKQCRIIEFPRYANFAQAFPGTMPYSESFGFISNLEDEDGNNVIDAVVAHEIAHQWWAHQVVGANMQGGTMMSESFAEYSSLMTMKSIAKTPMKMREFLKYDHNRYLRGRSSEIDKERPLYQVENQTHIHYGKGSVILYALQDFIGEDKVNLAMKNFLDEYKYKPPPYPTSLDFLKHLEPQVPDSMRYLIDDWIKDITLYDNRLKKASYTQLDNGKYQVSLEVESHKIKADTIGNETRVPMNDWVDIGFFADKDEEDLVYEERVKIDQETMNITVELDELPAKAAIDPRRLLIDRVFDDNVKSVTEE